jgi:hypothetical protein
MVSLLGCSGHGGQVRDVSGDEDDGLDETILTCDNQQIIGMASSP